jgi:hypothetical protein
MKIAEILISLLNEELQGKPCLLRVDIPIAQGDEWTWMLLFFEDIGKADNLLELNRHLLELLSPIHEGEIVGHSNEDSLLYYAASDFIPERSLRDILFQSPIGDTLPSYVKDSLMSSINDLSSFFFLRIKKEIRSLDADYLVRKIREETWFRARTVPYIFSKRQVEITVGAQHKTLVPQRQQPILCFESKAGYYAAFQKPAPEKAVKYNLYCSDGQLETITCNRDEFLSSINFPLGEIYGFDLDIPLEFEAFLPSSNEAASIVLCALRESPEVHYIIYEIVRQRLNEMKQQTLERLEERRRRLQKRKSVFLGSEGKEIFLGFEPTNENELIILASKLENTLAKKLGCFRILEHTGQLGIDGLIQIRRTPGSNFEEAASVEFEYELSNFFKHGHPVLQTNYIICWTLGNLKDGTLRMIKGGIRPDDSLAVELKASGWMKVLSFEDHVIHVLPLENLPCISVRKADN